MARITLWNATWLLAALVAGCRLVQANPCRFPDYLTSRSRWETRISMERKRVQTFFKFHGRIMEKIDFGPLGENHVTQECVQSMPGDKFLLRRAADGTGVTDYVCVQFLRRSDNVLQLKLSQREEFPSMVMCEDERLSINDWPLVWPKAEATPTQNGACGFSGGFDFHLHDLHDGDPLCAETWLRPRMEVDCMTGDGLSFDFRNYECRGDLKIDMQQNLDCLGSWEDKDYIYTVLTDSGELWPRLWILRLPVQQASTFDAFLSGDIIADNTPNMALARNFYRMTAKRSDYPSVCENEASGCKDCDGYNDFYCQKSCNRCDPQDSLKDCNFDDDLRGDWEELSHWGNRDITVASSVLYADGLSPFECIRLPGTSDLQPRGGLRDGQNHRIAMVTVYRNGCKPRYTCVEFRRQGQSVMQYRISQHLVWPYTLSIGAQDVCTSDRFADDSGALGDQYRSEDFKIILRKANLNTQLPSADCGIKGWFTFIATYVGGNTCRGTVRACNHDDNFVMNHEGCHDDADEEESFRCVASFTEGQSRIVVTEKEDDPLSKHCWVIHYFEDWGTWQIYKLRPSDCNLHTANGIKYQNQTSHLAEFRVHVDSDRGMDDEARCREPPPDHVGHLGSTTSRPPSRRPPVNTSPRWPRPTSRRPEVEASRNPNVNQGHLVAGGGNHVTPTLAVLVFVGLYHAVLSVLW